LRSGLASPAIYVYGDGCRRVLGPGPIGQTNEEGSIGLSSNVSANKFEDYWKVLKPNVAGELTQLRGMQRLNRSRNDLKHNGVSPSAAMIALAVGDTATFMAATRQAVFGVDYSAVSMVDVVGQDAVRERLRAAETSAAVGTTRQAMIDIRDAYEILFKPHASRPSIWPDRSASPFAFGADMRWKWTGARKLADKMQTALRTGHYRSDGYIRDVSEQLAMGVESAVQMREAVHAGSRDRLPGIRQVQPSHPRRAHLRQREARVPAPTGYAPTQDEVRFCVEFVVTAALRLAAAESQQVDPGWITRDQWGRVDWEDIAEIDQPQPADTGLDGEA
jgi:hypothetical protein